jgi:hypothetical protein
MVDIKYMDKEEIEKIINTLKDKGVACLLFCQSSVKNGVETRTFNTMTQESQLGIMIKRTKELEYEIDQQIAKQFYDRK